MKLLCAAVLTLVSTCVSVFGQTTLHPEIGLDPVTPALLGAGGAGVADASGFDSLYLNPAGFARDSSSFTLIGIDPALYFVPNRKSFAALGGFLANPSLAISKLSPTIDANGVGGNLSAGLGYVGHGLGLGLLSVTDVYANSLYGESGKADAYSTLAFIGGLGFNVANNLLLGGSVRPMLRAHAPDVSLTDLATFGSRLGISSPQIPAFYGFGVGVDLGLLWVPGPFSIGLSLRDVAGTRFYYLNSTLAKIVMNAENGRVFPAGNDTGADQYVVPMSVDLAAEYHPDLGKISSIIDPTIQAEYDYYSGQDLTSAVSLLSGVHVGLEVKLFSMLALRAGFNGGYFTAGVGLRLAFLSLDAAYFARQGGAGALPNNGVTAGLSIEF